MLAVNNVLTSSLKKIPKTLSWTSSSCFSSFTQTLFIRASPVLMGEPAKKKKKPDSGISKLREEKKKKRLWRDIKRLVKIQKQLKPIDELEIPYALVDEPEKYAREKVILSEDEWFARGELREEWSLYRMKRHWKDLQMIDRIVKAQEKALSELEEASPFLYEEAVKVDFTYFPISIDGPTDTPPIKDYVSPNGDYIDCTKKWTPVYVPEMDKKLKKQRAEAKKAEIAAARENKNK